MASNPNASATGIIPGAENLTKIPAELKQLRQWIVWRLEQRDADAKPTKIPYAPTTGHNASTTNPETWGSFEDAVHALESGRYTGLGFVFTEDDPYAGIDLDGYLNPDEKRMHPDADRICQVLRSYTETSPSGTGLHIIVRGRAPDRKNSKTGVEAYSSKRFFTVTGDALQTTDAIPERQIELDAVAMEHFAPEPVRETTPPTPTEPVELADSALLERARSARNGDEFKKLYDQGDWSEYPSQSEADHRLCCLLAFWTAWDQDRIYQLFAASALDRPKWRRRSYHEKTIRNAIAATPRAYRQRPQDDANDLSQTVAVLRAHAERMSWTGRSGPTDYHAYGALLELAERYGTLRKNGIVVAADARTVALAAGISFPTAKKALQRLRDDWNLVRLSKRGRGTRAAVYLLKVENAAQGLPTKLCALYGQPLSQVRNARPMPQKAFDKKGRPIYADSRFWLQRLGKLSALILEHIGKTPGGVTEDELADALERRTRNLRRQLEKLTNAGLVERTGADCLVLPEDFERRLEVELQESGCRDAEERDRKKYADEREAFRRRLEHIPDAAPSVEDMDAKRRQRVMDALEAFGREGSGPQRILYSYLDGETRTFEYIVKAVAYYYGSVPEGDGWQMWREAVRDAYALYVGETREKEV